MQFTKIQSLLAAVILLGTPLVSLAAPAPDALAVTDPNALALPEPVLIEREAVPQRPNNDDDDDNNNNDDDDDDDNNTTNNNNNQRTVSTCAPRNGNNSGFRACVYATFYRNQKRRVRIRFVLNDTRNGDGGVRGQYSIYPNGRGNGGGNGGGSSNNNNNNNGGRRSSDVFRANDRNRRTTNTRTWNLDRDIQYVQVQGWKERGGGGKTTSDRLNNPFN
ncbi:hypothetical protein CERZMDRAFT_80229 [Cercospora zeae-maydis SCOH1-5]|uniref:Uncharacterized protein n=1 Tax=Cercospora zeae-maydis SCOH1-5 TaxID=717836 RepID=A0A6A6FVV5_9PEZI|nr:hypothetical protein CERZMDRAFT_80229 [Cercospora zeae-maydis SCOH1-5]